MFRYKCRIFGLLLYKNFLVRKRYWKSALFLEILATLFLFLGVWAMRNMVPLRAYDRTTGNSTVYPIKSADDYVDELEILLVVPDNQFTKNLARRVQKCLRKHVPTIGFDSEANMMEAQKTNRTLHNALGLIFDDKSVSYLTTNLRYKIELPWSLPRALYSDSMTVARDRFENGFTGLLLCVDQSLIQIKKNDMVNVKIRTQRMPEPAEGQTNILDIGIRRAFAGFAVAAFFIPLCIETAHASKEKFLGINVLMAMNGVPNHLNLLSWLVSALIFSMLYITPITLLLTLYTTEDVPMSFIHYGNPFILWLLLVLNVAHLVTFGMHVSAYFTRSLFMTTGLLILYVGAIVLQENAFKDSGLSVVPFLGVFIPDLLLFRGLEEINYYEDIRERYLCSLCE
ncbi:uncharacterized protein LOC131673316 [Phymastichus coffea]|uniref:uncharacterized protein LOC131673316 n=1 Tax=Phymastichus coffea TaxID=108790 RepID=UPI00273BB773|nr:uncharacterized protein LOC131673316 [Phymastichus coffea]